MIFQLSKRSMATSDAGRKRGVGANQSGLESTSSTQGGTRCPPSLGLIDSQSVEMAQKGAEFGVDGNKKVKGRKRHVMVDVLGLVVSCYVSAVNLANVKAAPAIGVPALENNARLVKVLADQGYQGSIAQRLQQAYDCVLELTQKLGQGFGVESWRWVVERTFAWLGNARRLCRDYEKLARTSRGFCLHHHGPLKPTQTHAQSAHSSSHYPRLETASKALAPLLSV